jgi:anti-anti-sigma factor
VRGFGLTVDELAPGVLRVALSGELDLMRTLLLDRELHALEARAPDGIVIDLHALDFIDSSGLGRLLSALRRARRGGWRLQIVRGGDDVQRIMALCALDRMLPLVGDADEALAAVVTARG